MCNMELWQVLKSPEETCRLRSRQRKSQSWVEVVRVFLERRSCEVAVVDVHTLVHKEEGVGE